MKKFRKINSQSGFSIMEVLIAGLITGVLAVSAFQFYTKMQGQSEAQYNVSEMSQVARASIYEIRKSLLQAGFKIGAHAPYEISGDTLAVYYSDTQPVDTIKYYLVEFTDLEYATTPNLPGGTQLFKLVKKVNSAAAEPYADYVTGVNYNQIDAANLIITIDVLSMRSDDSYTTNNGYRTFSISERIKVRNVS